MRKLSPWWSWSRSVCEITERNFSNGIVIVFLLHSTRKNPDKDNVMQSNVWMLSSLDWRLHVRDRSHCVCNSVCLWSIIPSVPVVPGDGDRESGTFTRNHTTDGRWYKHHHIYWPFKLSSERLYLSKILIPWTIDLIQKLLHNEAT